MSFNVKFRQPSNILVSGPSQTGKSNFLYRLIKNKHLLFTSVPKSVFYVYPSQHPLLDKMIEEKLVDKVLKSLPENVESLEKLLTNHKADGSILVIDDALTQLRPYLPQLFEVLSHRANCTIILVSQNNFVDSATFRRASNGCHYHVLMKHARNSMKVRNLLQQIDNCNVKFGMDAYKDAVKLKKPLGGEGPPIYGYVVLDVYPFTNESTRIRSSIFPEEHDPVTVYTDNKTQ